jgi:hypothetical protein
LQAKNRKRVKENPPLGPNGAGKTIDVLAEN